jgi:hypothetical protein
MEAMSDGSRNGRKLPDATGPAAGPSPRGAIDRKAPSIATIDQMLTLLSGFYGGRGIQSHAPELGRTWQSSRLCLVFLACVTRQCPHEAVQPIGFCSCFIKLPPHTFAAATPAWRRPQCRKLRLQSAPGERHVVARGHWRERGVR